MKVNVIDGQMDLFSMPIQEPIKTKEIIVAKPKMEQDNFKDIISLYKDTCNRIVKIVSGALLVELEDKTLYFNSEGKDEFNLGIDVGLTPSDEIIIANVDKNLNDIQLSKLAIMDPTQYIKRKGDSSIIIPTGTKTIVINKNGWVIEWIMKPIFKEDEVVLRVKEEQPQDEELRIGDKVQFKYSNEQCVGEIKSIYNNGETINVSWNGKHTAFFHKCLKKVIA